MEASVVKAMYGIRQTVPEKMENFPHLLHPASLCIRRYVPQCKRKKKKKKFTAYFILLNSNANTRQKSDGD